MTFLQRKTLTIEVAGQKIVEPHGDMHQPLIEDLLRSPSRHPDQLKELVGFKIVAGVVGPNRFDCVVVNDLRSHSMIHGVRMGTPMAPVSAPAPIYL